MFPGLIAKMVGLIVFGLSKDTPSIIFSFVLDGFGIWAYSSFFSIISQVPINTILYPRYWYKQCYIPGGVISYVLIYTAYIPGVLYPRYWSKLLYMPDTGYRMLYPRYWSKLLYMPDTGCRMLYICYYSFFVT